MKRIVVAVALLASLFVLTGAASTDGTTTRFFIRDTVQASLDLGEKGPSQGDQFTYHGNIFTKEGGRQIGRYGGTCMTFAASPGVPEDSDCTLHYILPKGRLMTRLIGTTADVFGGRPVVFSVLGGTGAYRSARGDGTIVVPTDVPNQTDALIVLRLR
ncbi:MAG TPA: hypothetical protein VG034_08885 [Acidimicrobiia bacterium]|jgi:hypothetical protein|nr:hypothetical protein [Acidimicrobiia bacterium]